MTDLSAIEEGIVAALTTISEFKKVYDHEPLEIGILPSASMFYTGFNQTDKSMPNTQEVSHNWAVRLYYPLQDAKKAQDSIKSLIIQTRTAFQKHRDFGGTCLYNQVTSGSVGVFMDKNNPQMIAELSVSAMVYER